MRADEMGARICGEPMSLASALAKIADAAEVIPNETAEQAPATAHLFIVNPLSGARMDNLFSTHSGGGELRCGTSAARRSNGDERPFPHA